MKILSTAVMLAGLCVVSYYADGPVLYAIGASTALIANDVAWAYIARRDRRVEAVKKRLREERFAPGDIFYAADAKSIAKLSAGQSGSVLKVKNGGPTWVP